MQVVGSIPHLQTLDEEAVEGIGDMYNSANKNVPGPRAGASDQQPMGWPSSQQHQQDGWCPMASTSQEASTILHRPRNPVASFHSIPSEFDALSMTRACNGHEIWQSRPRPPSSPPLGRPRRQSPGAASPSNSLWTPPHDQAPCANSSTSPFLRFMSGEQLCHDLQSMTSSTNNCQPAQARTSAAAGRGPSCTGPNMLNLDSDPLGQADYLKRSGLSMASCSSFQPPSQQLRSSRGQAGTATAMTNDYQPSISRHNPSSSLNRHVSSQCLRPASPSFAFRRRMHLLNSCANQSPESHDRPCNSISSAGPQNTSGWLADQLQTTPATASSLRNRPSGTDPLLSADEGKISARPALSIDASSCVSCSGNSSDTIGWICDSPNLEGRSSSQQSPFDWGQMSRDSLTSPFSSMDLLLQQVYQRPDIHDRPDTAWNP